MICSKPPAQSNAAAAAGSSSEHDTGGALTQSRVCCSAQGKSEKMAEAKTAAAPAVRARGVSHTPLALAPRAA